MNGKIYMLTNNMNNMKYIGQTFEDVPTRIQKGYSKTTQIGTAIRRDGLQHFTYQILETGINTQQSLDDRENYYIRHYGTLYPNGYNERWA